MARAFWPARCLGNLVLVLALCLGYTPARAEAPGRGDTPGSENPADFPQPPVVPPASGSVPPAPAAAELPGATASPPAPSMPGATPSTPPAPPAVPDTTFAGALGKTADHTHDLLERGFLQQVINLDDFFGKTNSPKEVYSSYLLRWRNSLRLQQGGGVNLGSTLRANVDLSKINERLQLSISGEDKPDQFAPSLPEDPGSPGFDRTFNSARIVNTELRYQLLRTPVTDFFLGAGVDFVWPPQVFARARIQRYQRLSDTFLANFAETFFVKTPDGIGETTELSLDWSLNPKTVLRWASSGTVSQEINALEWGSELSLLHEITSRSAVTLTGGIYGNTGFNDWITNYRILLRYRRNALRSWLFYELEPQVTWPRNTDGSFPINYAVTFRFEVVFQGEEKHGVERP